MAKSVIKLPFHNMHTDESAYYARHFAECEERPENARTPTPPPRLSQDADCYSVSPARVQS